MRTDAIVRIRFLTTNEGGRTRPVSGKWFGCPLFAGSRGFDCRLLLDGATIALGEWHDLPVAFLSPDLAFQELGPGSEIALWEGKTVATGTVVKVFPDGA